MDGDGSACHQSQVAFVTLTAFQRQQTWWEVGDPSSSHRSVTVTWLPGKDLTILLPVQEGHPLGTQEGQPPIIIFKLAHQARMCFPPGERVTWTVRGQRCPGDGASPRPSLGQALL